ncbi:MAG TPA: AAA family ATPase, partial [Chloroflexota bacterium]
GRLLPDLEFAFSSPGGSGEEDQHRLLRAVSGFVQAIAEELPVALLLDDLHWADSASLNLFLHLARQTRNSHVLLLGTYRDIEVDRHHPLERALIDLNRERLMERVVLYRPGQEDTAALIAATVGDMERLDELAALVHEATSGNPFFVQEVLRALVERGDIYQYDGRWRLRDVHEVRVPESVHSAVGERLSRLRPEAQDIVSQASVLGQTFSFDDLWGVSQYREEEIEEALEEAIRAGLIRETGPDGYTFMHALTHQALYDGLSARKRRRIHLAAGEVLDRLPERLREQRVAELAWHFLEGRDAERAVRYASRAGDRALAAFAYGEAERYYRTILDLPAAAWFSDERAAGDEGQTMVEAETLAKVGRVLNIMERYDDALTVLEQAAELYHRHGDVGQEGQIVAEIGWVHRARGTVEEGIARIQPLITSLEPGDGHVGRAQTLSGLYTALARLFFKLDKHQEELDAAERAADLARRVGNDAILAVAEARRGAALMTLGRRTQASEVLEEAATLAESTGNFGTMSVALDNLGELFREGGDFDRSRMYLARALHAAEQSGGSGRIAWTFEQSGGAGRIAWILTRLARITFLLGDWVAALAHLERAVELFRSAGLEWQATYALVHLWCIQVLSGEGADTTKHLEDVLAAADPLRDVWIVRHVERFLAEIDLLEGRPQAALARLQSLVDPASLDYPQALELLRVLAQAYLGVGNVPRAQELLAICIERGRTQNERLYLVDMREVQGRFFARQERWEEARSVFREMEDMARDMSFPYGEARALYECGVMLIQRGSPMEAREQLEQAGANFKRLGAGLYLERTERARLQLV